MSGGRPTNPAKRVGDPGVEVWYTRDGSVAAYGYSVHDEHWLHMPGLASFWFDRSSDAVVATAQPGGPQRLIEDAYNRFVLPLVLQVRGWEVLHASAVQIAAGVVALCGASATGKSTVARALSQHGYPVWADDAVVFEVSGGVAATIRLPFVLRLLPDAALFFDRVHSARVNGRNGAAPETGDGKAPLAALFVLTRSTDDSEPGTVRAVRMRPVRAFTTILDHARCFNIEDAERKQRTVAQYLNLAERVPVYELRFRPGFENFPLVVDRIEDAIAR